MSEVFCSHEVNFEKSDIVFNVLTNKVLPESRALKFLEIERDGRKLYGKFIEEWIVASIKVHLGYHQ